jgi:hypothetical protein
MRFCFTANKLLTWDINIIDPSVGGLGVNAANDE